jgi:hypothetical protein
MRHWLPGGLWVCAWYVPLVLTYRIGSTGGPFLSPLSEARVVLWDKILGHLDVTPICL